MTIFGAFSREVCHEENPERRKLTKLIVPCRLAFQKIVEKEIIFLFYLRNCVCE